MKHTDVIRDLLNTMRDASKRLERGDDPDDVAEFLTYAAGMYSTIRIAGEPVTLDLGATYSSKAAAVAAAYAAGLSEDEARMRVSGCIPFDGRWEIHPAADPVPATDDFGAPLLRGSGL